MKPGMVEVGAWVEAEVLDAPVVHFRKSRLLWTVSSSMMEDSPALIRKGFGSRLS
jgi:hypothetical protein